jgi:hypothetical protein
MLSASGLSTERGGVVGTVAVDGDVWSAERLVERACALELERRGGMALGEAS